MNNLSSTGQRQSFLSNVSSFCSFCWVVDAKLAQFLYNDSTQPTFFDFLLFRLAKSVALEHRNGEKNSLQSSDYQQYSSSIQGATPSEKKVQNIWNVVQLSLPLQHDNKRNYSLEYEEMFLIYRFTVHDYMVRRM